MMDLSAHLAHRASWTPGKTALRFEGRAHTYADLERAVSAGTSWLRSQDVGRGDRVAFLGPNCPALVEMLYACARLSAIFVPLNARMPASELRVFAEQSRPSLLAAEQSFHDVATAIAPEEASTFRPRIGRPRRSRASPAGSRAGPSRTGADRLHVRHDGAPQRCRVHHHNLILSALKMITDDGLTGDDEVLVASPLFHVAALLSLALPSLWAGATLTIHRQAVRKHPGHALRRRSERTDRGVPDCAHR